MSKNNSKKGGLVQVTAAKGDPIAPCADGCARGLILVENEFVCIKCGRVDAETSREFWQSEPVSEMAGRMSTAKSHHLGSALLNSATVQSSYVSKKDKGVAFELNDTFHARDYAGRRINKQLVDPYVAGLAGDPARGAHTVEDSLTGRRTLEFSRLDVPTVQLCKERALQRSMSLGLDLIAQATVASDLKKINSRLIQSLMVDYSVLTSLLKHKHTISKSDAQALEQELAQNLLKIKKCLLSNCNVYEGEKHSAKARA